MLNHLLLLLNIHTGKKNSGNLLVIYNDEYECYSIGRLAFFLHVKGL